MRFWRTLDTRQSTGKMQLPDSIQAAIDALLEKIPPSTLKKAAEMLSKTYRSEGASPPMFREETLRFAYLASRLPATYAAVYQVLKQIPCSLSRWVDVGAGPGTASWAAATLFPFATQATLIEKSLEAITLGKRLIVDHPIQQIAEWRADCLPGTLPDAEALIFSYSLGEFDRPLDWIASWWQTEIPFLVVVEPGTPRGFSLIRQIRDQVIAMGASLIAPCPHLRPCPMKEGDWCHFSVRLERSRLQRYLKGGSLGYEDEKYSYLIASRFSKATPPFSRILRHPQKHSGHVKLALCTPQGTEEQVIITRSNKQFYRQARDASWGDSWK